MGALSTGTGSIEIPVLCLLVNGDPSTLEVGQGREAGAWWETPGRPRLPAGPSLAWDRAPLARGLRTVPKLTWGPLSPP